VTDADHENQQPVVVHLIEDAIVAMSKAIGVLEPTQRDRPLGRGSVAKLSMIGASRLLISGASFRNSRRAAGVKSTR
jgi:hypothetical protein